MQLAQEECSPEYMPLYIYSRLLRYPLYNTLVCINYFSRAHEVLYTIIPTYIYKHTMQQPHLLVYAPNNLLIHYVQNFRLGQRSQCALGSAPKFGKGAGGEDVSGLDVATPTLGYSGVH